MIPSSPTLSGCFALIWTGFHLIMRERILGGRQHPQDDLIQCAVTGAELHGCAVDGCYALRIHPFELTNDARRVFIERLHIDRIRNLCGPDAVMVGATVGGIYVGMLIVLAGSAVAIGVTVICDADKVGAGTLLTTTKRGEVGIIGATVAVG